MTNDSVLYLVASGAPLARRVADGAHAARELGWSPIVIPSAAAEAWIDRDTLRSLGVPVVAEHRQVDQPKVTPRADALVVVPTTFNTLTSWANGAASTFVQVTLCACLGARVPTVAVPFAKRDLAGHPAWLASLAVLRYAGVTIVDPQTGTEGDVSPLESGTGETAAAAFNWNWVLSRLPAL